MELAYRGHEIHFISYANPIRLDSGTPRIHYHEVEVTTYPLFEYPPYCLALASRMAEVAESYKLDLLHVHYAIPHSISALLARDMMVSQMPSHRRLPFITTLHGTDITIVGQDRSFHAITKFSIEKSDRITAVSNFLKDETFYAFGCAGCDVEVIHNFIDPALYNRQVHGAVLRQQMGQGDRKILMHVSNFRAVKRVRDVIRIFAKVHAELPSTLVMVGDGPDRDDAEEEARTLGVDRDVHFLGKIEQVAPLLASADLFLLPSNRESFGLSALEALASGVPVIGCDVGGLPEVVREGETGALRPPADVDGMASAALEILGDPVRWSQMSRLAAADARERFSQDAVVAQYEALYLSTLARR